MAIGLGEEEFWNACCDLHTRAVEASNLNFQVKLFKGPPQYMQITRVVPINIQQSSDGDEDDDGVGDASFNTFEEVEDNVVYSTTEIQAGVKVDYSVSYSQTYRTPVLYFRIGDLGEMNKLQFIYEHLVPNARSKELQTVGIMGAISQTNHPATNVPCFFVHPCRTSEAMESLTLHRDPSASEYLQIWIGLIGSSVGLNLPIELAVK